MSTDSLILASDLAASMSLLSKGKVRDMYEVDNSTLLIVTTDRISAFDVALDTGIPNKGSILTILTAHWAKVLSEAIPDLRTHFVTLGLPPQIPSAQHDIYQHRSMQVHKLLPFKIEAIVRSHLTREAWCSYQVDSTVCGILIPSGLLEGQAFPDGPIYTPSTKAAVGDHDEDISEAQAAEIVGPKYADRIKELSLSIYKIAAAYALERGIIIVDTKFEFGLDTSTDDVVLADEILTPESSRFWPVENYEVGQDSAGLDKQFLRDWLGENGLAGEEGVVLPEEVVKATEAKYREAFARLVGKSLDEGLGQKGR
ncbi:MAG: hypothetical protein L6R40_003093 [Gallowayella cf. fulva]|nr:MAG: hypothetical protein L6R40_003093 [Xanthomendoza cf. fulva]